MKYMSMPFSEIQNLKQSGRTAEIRPRKSDTERVFYKWNFWFLIHFKYQPPKSRLMKEKGFPYYGVP